ncbi:hypothetical protein LK09_15535 [Microbacterium mangrovi]|uniref:Integral membrane bound transporter domain-containing protein n=1 Tax=Microbacterium mangrovi TaxID=1348253 RepID=A0A0B2A3S2_9MICO|nr:hypothetical protein LK09_15535 [Microbacterium mangrovi]
MWVRSLVSFAPAPAPRWPMALQAALSMFVPVGLFTLLGHPSVGLMAASGAFTVIYVAWATPAQRIRILPVIGLALLVCAALGAVVAPWPAVAAIGLVVVAIVSSALHYGYRLGPPGPLFFVLVYGLATHVTAVVGGKRVVDPLLFLAAFAAGVAIAYLIAVVAAVIMHSVRRPDPDSVRRLPRTPSLDADSRALLVRVAIVAVLGTLLSVLLVDTARAYWTVCAGLAVIGVNAGRRAAFVRGNQRLVGTVVGAGLFAGLAFLPIPVWLLPFLLGGLQYVVEILVVRNYALALVFITPLVLIITSTAGAASGVVTTALILERVVDTLVGALLGAASGIVHPRRARVG